ncbi:hypothetical protein M0R45_029575 [Rubus argutus]|uniref:CHY-type domain-containing protein n=1 Tax=Rubus argutus TaxID=59490 RepID=A0AAW1WCE8_RUBAR
MSVDDEHSPPQNQRSVAEKGSGKLGCMHYRRRCKIIAPCCDEVFDCRHCHNESKNSLKVDPIHRHDVPRHDLKRVICSLCNTEQDVQQHCSQCGVCMGNYFLLQVQVLNSSIIVTNVVSAGLRFIVVSLSYFWSSICTCLSAFQLVLQNWRARRTFSTATDVELLLNAAEGFTQLCGKKQCIIIALCVLSFFRYDGRHYCLTMWAHYTSGMCEGDGEAFPGILALFVQKSYCDMSHCCDSDAQMYQNKIVWILCNDCGGESSEVSFHIVAHKCLKCKSYNTRQTQGGPASCSSRVSEMVR